VRRHPTHLALALLLTVMLPMCCCTLQVTVLHGIGHGQGIAVACGETPGDGEASGCCCHERAGDGEDEPAGREPGCDGACCLRLIGPTPSGVDLVEIETAPVGLMLYGEPVVAAVVPDRPSRPRVVRDGDGPAGPSILRITGVLRL